MHPPEDTALLFDLLVEAADEPVTLDELEVAGVADPARALFELELAGHEVSRVFDRTHEGQLVTCVRLTPAPARKPEPEPDPVVAHADPVVVSQRPTARPAPPRPLVVAAALLALLLALLATRS